MMTVNEFSRRSDVAAHVVRYYARIGLLEPVRHPVNGYKLFSRADAMRLRFIRNAQRLGYSLEEIRSFLALSGKGKSVCREVRAILRRHLIENQAKLEDLTALQQRMERALELWETLPDGKPDDTRVCHLIEGAATAMNA
jgi:MerR family Zn(II)-responsive transcriptional regulator of zntA